MSLQLCPQENSPCTTPKVSGNIVWAQCLYQCLNTSKWNKDRCHHNKKKLSAPSPASQPTSRMPGRCGMSHSKAKPILLLLCLLRRIKCERRRKAKGCHRKLHQPEALKYERGTTTARAWGLGFCLWAKKKKQKREKNQHAIHNKKSTSNLFMTLTKC